jgi:hypothetical protein
MPAMSLVVDPAVIGSVEGVRALVSALEDSTASGLPKEWMTRTRDQRER